MSAACQGGSKRYGLCDGGVNFCAFAARAGANDADRATRTAAVAIILSVWTGRSTASTESRARRAFYTRRRGSFVQCRAEGDQRRRQGPCASRRHVLLFPRTRVRPFAPPTVL
jgi:hypothetical protein